MSTLRNDQHLHSLNLWRRFLPSSSISSSSVQFLFLLESIKCFRMSCVLFAVLIIHSSSIRKMDMFIVWRARTQHSDLIGHFRNSLRQMFQNDRTSGRVHRFQTSIKFEAAATSVYELSGES